MRNVGSPTLCITVLDGTLPLVFKICVLGIRAFLKWILMCEQMCCCVFTLCSTDHFEGATIATERAS
jgi:hypothetical protein